MGSIQETLPSDVDFDSFVKVVKRPDGFKSPGEPEDLIRGFQIFDKDNTGYIGVGELRYGMSCHKGSSIGDTLLTRLVLTSLGERMSVEDVDEILKGVNTKDGNVHYAGQFTLMMSMYTQLIVLRRLRQHDIIELRDTVSSRALTLARELYLNARMTI